MSAAPLLDVRDLRVHFPVAIGGTLIPRRALLKAVDGVSFSLMPGETLAVVGESGCGKSTLCRAVLGLIRPTAGAVIWRGQEIHNLPARKMRALRRDMQMVFQDPLAALDPRMTAGEIIAEPLVSLMPSLGRADIKTRAAEMMARVGLSPHMVNRYPHEFSGGQCQRIGIARALILGPALIVCDEPVSALDVSIQAQIVNLLMRLQRELGLALILVSHDLAVVRHLSHRVLVLYLGQEMESADRDRLYAQPRHPYTQALLAAVPVPDPDLAMGRSGVVLAGDPPSPFAPPSGCVFRTRCLKATALCAETAPPREHVAEGHDVFCHHWRESGVMPPQGN